jgi:ribosomal protein S18 acetylase RimI-like enzyme
MLRIRRAVAEDFEEIWPMMQQVIAAGDSYTYPQETTAQQARSIWMGNGVNTYVAFLADELVGTYILRPNHSGRGSHVANAGYIVKSSYQGKGVGRALCEHSLAEARRAGFLALQFNMVVSTNESAVALWKKMGFSVVGTLPKAFRHRELGLVDAFIMHRFL